MPKGRIDNSTGWLVALIALGFEIIKTEPITLDDLCATGCQYAKDVAMPEYSCSGECQYELAARLRATA